MKLNDLNAVEADASTLRKIEIRKARIDYVLKLLGLSYVVAFSIGAVLMYLYFFRNEFSSGGISPSDTISLALLSFSFFAIVVIAVLIGSFVAYPWMYYIHRLWPKAVAVVRRGAEAEREGNAYQLEWRENQLVLRLLALSLTLLIAVGGIGAPAAYWQVMSSIVALGVFPAMSIFGEIKHSYCVYPRPKDAFSRWLQEQPTSRRQFVVNLLISAAMLVIGFGLVQDAAFERLGLRKQNVSVRMQKEDFVFMTQSALHGGFTVNPCEQIRPDEFIMRNVDVLWNKLGSQSLLRFPSKPLADSSET